MPMYDCSEGFLDGLVGAFNTAMGNGGKAVVCASGGTALLTITLNAGAPVGAATAGVASFAAPQSGGASWATFSQLPSANGTANYISFRTSADAEVAKETVSTKAAGTGAWQFDSLTFETTVAVKFTEAPVYTQAGA